MPEFTAATEFKLDASRLVAQLAEARAQGVKAKPVIIGPVTYLSLGKAKDNSSKLDLLQRLLPVYAELLDTLAAQGAEWVQIDEPILVTELGADWQHAFNTAYHHLKTARIKILLATYFGELAENKYLAANLPVAGLHIDAINGQADVQPLLVCCPHTRCCRWRDQRSQYLEDRSERRTGLGGAAGRAPGQAPLDCADLLSPACARRPEQRRKARRRGQILAGLCAAKLDELRVLGKALTLGRDAVKAELAENAAALAARRNSTRVHNPAVRTAVAQITAQLGQRQSSYGVRAARQAALLKLPSFPTTTIGSSRRRRKSARPVAPSRPGTWMSPAIGQPCVPK